MRKSIAKLGCLCLLATAGSAGLVSAASILSAKRDIARLRYDLAESKLVDIARTLSGERRQEGLFLLAGLKSSASESEIIYQEIICSLPASAARRSLKRRLSRERSRCGAPTSTCSSVFEVVTALLLSSR